MSFVHPFRYMGEPEREVGPPSLQVFAARNVARQMQMQMQIPARRAFEELEASKGGIESAFQKARADAIAQVAASTRKNEAAQDYIDAYEMVMFTPPQTEGPRDSSGLTASMRSRKRLMQADLRDPYYAKIQRLANRDQEGGDTNWLPETLTPAELHADRRPYPGYFPEDFVRYLFQYYDAVRPPGPGHVWPSDAVRELAQQKHIDGFTAESLVELAHGQWMASR